MASSLVASLPGGEMTGTYSWEPGQAPGCERVFPAVKGSSGHRDDVLSLFLL